MPEAIAIRAAVEPGNEWQRAVRWLRGLLRGSKRHPRRLRLCETLGLGERRLLAVVEFERQRFLLGATGNSLVLLTALPDRDAGEDIRASRKRQDGRQD